MNQALGCDWGVFKGSCSQKLTREPVGLYFVVVSIYIYIYNILYIDAMRIGGNKNAQAYFRKHGTTAMHAKIEKKYTSKTANAYKTELAKLVDAEAAKRGGGPVPDDGVELNSDLLANLELVEKAGVDGEARAKLTAARAAGNQQALPQAKLASTLAGASRLVVTPPSSGGAPKLVLRKPAGGSKAGGFNMMKKKPTAGGNKLKINKLGSSTAAAATTTAADDFDSFEATQQPEAPEPEAPAPAAPVPVVAAAPPVAAPAPPKEFSMKDGVDKLKGMNSDFFSSF